MKNESPAPHLDAKSLAQSGRAVAGRDVLSNYPRLMVETHGLGGDQALRWSATGELRVDEAGLEQVWMHVQASTCLPLTCQRCLGAVDTEVSVGRSFRFVDSEQDAEAQDELCDEDVLALNPDFSLADLIEDEILMDLPLVPRHEACPADVKLVAQDAGFETAMVEKRNPFSVLARLQGDKSGD